MSLALFMSAFLAATLVPGSSEALLSTLLITGQGDPGWLLLIATVGNVLGSVVNWMMGRYFRHFQDRRWFPVSQEHLERATGWYQHYGLWSLLFAWLPFFGDPLTVIAGVLRVRLLYFIPLVTLGKFARYLFVYWIAQGFIQVSS